MNKFFLLFAVFHITSACFSQVKDSTGTLVSGSINLTNNGISLVPTFTLGKPATIVDVALRRKRLSFEPQFAFALEDAKPWYFIFWLRYKLIEKSKFKMGVGFHPGFVFSTNEVINNGIAKEYFTAARFFVGELSPNYFISKNTSIGLYYLHSRGFNSDLKQLNFLGINTNFSRIKLGDKFFMRATPQIYYLKANDSDGLYFTSNFTLAKQGFPITVSSILNNKLQSSIPSDDFVWNISLAYSF